ncbi:MAG: ribonuclease HII [Flavobacteriaceae bacterium]|nr:ribonuclease HII [Flavobacteriaceae bacterium]
MLKTNLHSPYLEAGTDEAGRGCLAGPVVAAAVIFPNSYQNVHINDSKKLGKDTRLAMKIRIEKEALAYAVAFVGPQEIDQINILNASIKAMQLSLSELSPQPEHILVDGNRFKPYENIPHTCVVKGDSLYLSIAAASILAKTYRDAYMMQLHEEYPMYHWNKNKGYPTAEHREAILKYGITEYHRKSFNLFPKQLSLNL